MDWENFVLAIFVALLIFALVGLVLSAVDSVKQDNLATQYCIEKGFDDGSMESGNVVVCVNKTYFPNAFKKEEIQK
jgi:hypothetical protein